jgi:NADH:ubiquinone oxidoreductase subunit 5 (subunit L)/multisubunit Na+/H+ antiporter MnhA subunit
MTDIEQLLTILGLIVPGAPLCLLGVLGLAALGGWRLSERATSVIVQLAIFTGLFAALSMLVIMLFSGARHIPIVVGDWVAVPHYHFSLKLVFDRLSVPFVILSFILCGTIGAFASRYMHREPGFGRFFFLYALFLSGMVVTSLSDTIETLFAGWELVGLSSALLVAFFHERPGPVRNGLRVWSVYRFSDAALLIAAIMLHHLTGEGDFDQLLRTGGKSLGWPLGEASVSASQALVVGLLLLVAVAGKSALVPFSGWLPRAMEGPTPSSAVFYGALSVHLGAFLLLRVSPLLEASLRLCAAIVALGLITALFASLAGSVQTDIKSALCFASLTQVGVIVTEIGLGLRYVALVHILGHACLRTLQFVRAPTLLQDYRSLENAIGAQLPHLSAPLQRLLPERLRVWLYRCVLQRGYLDAILDDYIVGPLLRMFRACDACERCWTEWLSGENPREAERVLPLGETFDKLL